MIRGGIEITTYKEIKIYYSEESDKFHCEVVVDREKYNKEDRWSNPKKIRRASLKEVKNEIDSYIKKNLEFEPFECYLPDYSGDVSVASRHKVLGLRKDGSFITESIKHRMRSFTPFEEVEKSCLVDPQIEEEFKKIKAERSKALDNYDEKLKELNSRLKPVDVSKYKVLLKQQES
jgi:hypothetical protein